MPDKDQEPTIFTQSTTTTDVVNQPDATITPVAIPDSVQEFVGEGKKYGTVNSALEAIPHAQSHIATLEAENARLREEATKGATTADILDSINAQNKPTSDPVTVDPSAIATQVINTLNEQDALKQTEDNIAQADQETIAAYGDKAGQLTVDVAAKLGVGLDFMQKIAGESPKAFAKLLSDNKTEVQLPPAVTQSSINIQALANAGGADELSRPTKSVLSGASQTEVLAEFRRCGKLAEKDLAS